MTDLIKAAYPDERLAVPLKEIERRARRRPRRSAVLAVAAATATAAVVMIVAAGANSGPSAPAASDDPCREHFEMLGGSGGVPPTRLILRDGDDWVRVYPNGDMISTCRGTGERAVRTHGTRLDEPSGTLSLLGGRESVLKNGGVLLGRVPPGTTRIEARLDSGRVVEGRVDGDLFAIFAPDESFAGARISAYRAGAGLVAEVTAPTELEEMFDADAFGRMCEERGLRMLRERADLPQTMPPLRFRMPAADAGTIWVYAQDQAILACRWTPDGHGMTGYFLRAALPPGEWQEDVVAAGETGGWVIGRVPADAQRVEVTLRSGRVVEAALSPPFFAASWAGEPITGAGPNPARVALHQPGRIRTHDYPWRQDGPG